MPSVWRIVSLPKTTYRANSPPLHSPPSKKSLIMTPQYAVNWPTLLLTVTPALVARPVPLETKLDVLKMSNTVLYDGKLHSTVKKRLSSTSAKITLTPCRLSRQVMPSSSRRLDVCSVCSHDVPLRGTSYSLTIDQFLFTSFPVPCRRP